MAYVEANHPETAQFMQSFNWTGGNTTPEGIVMPYVAFGTTGYCIVTFQPPLVGAETYSYSARWWAFGAIVVFLFDLSLEFSWEFSVSLFFWRMLSKQNLSMSMILLDIMDCGNG